MPLLLQATRMFALLETKPQPKLVLTLEVPAQFEQLVYFVRDPDKFVTKENINEVSSWGLRVHVCLLLLQNAY